MQDRVAATYMAQLFSAMSALHGQGIYHRHIKPQTLLLNSRFQLILRDFGHAKVVTSGDTLVTSTYCGTLAFHTPEQIARMPYRTDHCDLWASAVVMFSMLTRGPPFERAAVGGRSEPHATQNRFAFAPYISRCAVIVLGLMFFFMCVCRLVLQGAASEKI